MARRSRRPLLAAAAGMLAAMTAAGCVSMPTGGPVQSYPVTQGADGQNQTYVQIVPQPPQPRWTPTDIVEGFLTAAASFGDYGNIAYDYLTPDEREHWTRYGPAIVYKDSPTVTPATPPSSAKAPATVTVTVTGQEQATLRNNGSYSVASASTTDSSPSPTQKFTLVKTGGQWRISHAPLYLLLTSDSFQNDYQLRNLYFFDPSGKYLVPDPIYVPLQDNSGNLLNALVRDLVSPPPDWLSTNRATRTALPAGTKIRGVTASGVTAIVNLTGTIAKANADVMGNVSRQLLRTLTDTGQTAPNGHPIQSIELEVDGKPWYPPGAQGNPVQPAKKRTTPASSPFYFVDSAGYLNRQLGVKGKAARGLKIGAGASSVAVSPHGQYLAVLRGSTLYTGRTEGPLVKRGTGFQSVSWDVNDDLWAVLDGGLVLFRGAKGSKEPLSDRVTVAVASPVSAVRVAPDGVRVALVTSGGLLRIGAISGQDGPSPLVTFSEVQVKPINGATMFTGLSWYGPDDVITLAKPGPVATAYPVNGGSPVSIPVEPGMTSITSTLGSQLVAGLPDGHMVTDAGLAGAWTTLGNGFVPSYPG